MRFPHNLYAVKNKEGKYITDRVGIGYWAKESQEIEFWNSYTEAETFANYLNTNLTGRMYMYSPYIVECFILEKLKSCVE